MTIFFCMSIKTNAISIPKCLNDFDIFQVTIVSAFPQSLQPIENYREITVLPDIKTTSDASQAKLFQDAETGAHPYFELHTLLYDYLEWSNQTLNDREMQKLMLTQSFDLVVFGWMANDFQLGVAAHFNCPSIVLGPISAIKSLRDFVGNPADLTHVSSILLGYAGEFSFFQRVKNVATSFLEHAALATANYFYQEKFYRNNFPANKYPSLDEVKRNVSLVLVNHHFSLGGIRAYVPGMIEIGGYHIKPTADPLDSVNDLSFYL